MITEQDLQEAIAECEGVRNPNANTCIKLAAFYTIREHLFPVERAVSYPERYSFADAPTTTYRSDSEFGQTIAEMDIGDVLKIVDELMDTLHVMMPRLYDGVLRKLREV